MPFPGETALVAGSVYAGVTHHLSIVLVIVAAIVGAILGDNIGYTIGYRGGRPLIERIGHKRCTSNSARTAQDGRLLQRHGDKTVFFGRFVSVLRTYVALFAGINRMHWRRFVVFNAAGGVAWALIDGLLGYLLGGSPLLPAILHILGVGGLVLLGIVIVALVIGYIVWRRRRDSRTPAKD